MKKLLLLLIPFTVWSMDIEVALPTRSPLQPIYVSKIHTDQSDWRYCEELKSALEFDLNASGYVAVMDSSQTLEDQLHFPEPRAKFDVQPWEKNKIPFVIALEVTHNKFQATAFQIGKKSSKKYPEISLTGRIEEDRRSIHRLSDLIHKDIKTCSAKRGSRLSKSSTRSACAISNPKLSIGARKSGSATLMAATRGR
jgi:hypothetical protein